MNSFGRIFTVEIFGESHGSKVGVIIDGCPPGIALSASDLETDLARRRSGREGTTPRRESDTPAIVSGLFDGMTTGSPICITFDNADTQSRDYDQFSAVPRPGHADFTSRMKHGGCSDPRGSGHFSGRITVGLVAAGTIAKKIIPEAQFTTRIVSAGGRTDIDKVIAEAGEDSDSVGALVEIKVSGLAAGLGEPFFDACESMISHAVFAVPAVRGIEFGDGFRAASMKGSEHNDPFIDSQGHTAKNGAGGVNGGITNGNELVMRIAVKPTSSISKTQTTFNFKEGKMQPLMIEGRHDACIALRSQVVLESAVAISLADLALTRKATEGNHIPQFWRNR